MAQKKEYITVERFIALKQYNIDNKKKKIGLSIALVMLYFVNCFLPWSIAINPLATLFTITKKEKNTASFFISPTFDTSCGEIIIHNNVPKLPTIAIQKKIHGNFLII